MRLALLLLLLAAPAALAQTPLVPGQPASGTLDGESDAVYTLALEAGQFVAGVADQLSADVVVRIDGPDGETLDSFDGPALGPEPFQFTTEAAGTYRIVVAPFENASGDYTLVVDRVEAVATDPEGRVRQLMARYDRDDTPGGVIGVLRGGELVYAEAFGMANLPHGVPFTTETITNIGSTSKQFTAFAILTLAEQGLVDLDADVRTYLPELPDLGETVTVRHLLTHTSGYREFLNLLAMAGRRLDFGDYIAPAELVEVVQNQTELQNAPGAEWNYNNTAFGLAAQIVERVTDTPFPAWMAANVFAPAGMADTRVKAVPGEIIPRSAQGYVFHEGRWREAADLSGAVGAGSIYTTVADLARWMATLDGSDPARADRIAQMTTPYVLTDGEATEYGLGLFVDTWRGQRRIHHGGADMAHRSYYFYYPDLDAGVIALGNSDQFDGGIARDVMLAFFEEALQEPEEPAEEPAEADGEVTVSDELFASYAGEYALEAAPIVLTIYAEDGGYFAEASGQGTLPITPLSDSTFAVQGAPATLTFHRASDGSVPALTLSQGGQQMRAPRVAEEAAEAAPLSDYAGRYFSPELETYVRVRVEDGELVIRHRRFDEPVELTRADGDRFSGGFPYAQVAFDREGGAVTGLRAGNGRTRDIWFERVDG